MKKPAFTDLVDIEQIRFMLEAHQRVTGAVSAILDLEERILVAAGWQDVCTKFHRTHPEACRRCQESDSFLKERLPALDGEYLDYRCKNGMRDVAMPIIIAGEHLATFFTGQFFYNDEKPDDDYFRTQAREFGFDEESYLAAVRRAPIFTRDQVHHTMQYFRGLVHMLAGMGLKNLELAQEVRERQQAEGALRRTEVVLSSIFETIPDQLSLIDRGYRVIHSNRLAWQVARESGTEESTCHDYFFGLDTPCDDCHVKEVFETGTPVFTEKTNPRMGHVEVRAYPVFDETGAVATVLEHLRDINERRRADEALRESEQRLRTTIQGSSLPVFVLDTDRKVIHWNRALEQLTATREEDLLGTDRAWTAFHDTPHPLLADLLVEGKSDEMPNWYRMYGKSKLIDEAYECTHFSTKLPGGGRWLHFTAAALRDTRGNLIGAMETIEDVTERKFAEEKWHSLYDNLPGGSYTVNEERIIEDVNDVLCTVTGYSREELVGRPCTLICGNSHEGCHFLDLGVERLDNREMVLRGKDGRHIPILKSARRIATGNRLIVVENFQDMTEQKRLEEQLRHSQKMEAIGQLAGGVAHDFNNILTVILGNANLLQMKTVNDPSVEKHLEQIVKAAEKASHLTHSLLAFSRKHVVRLVAGKVTDIIHKAENLLSRLIPEDIELRFVTSGEYQVKADSVQIEQVLMNLVTNARDAMPMGGTVTVSTDELELEEGCPPPVPQMEPGKYVRITVSDNGIGIPQEMLQRIFEPFFTTKETGKGTGLGLAIVYAIVKQHEGYLTVQSERGKGTSVAVYLPAVAVQLKAAETDVSQAPPRGKETVLLAEDEPQVRELTKCLLEAFGYTVVEAEDGIDAVEKFNAHRDTIQLLLFDVIMPRMNGKMAYDRIREMSPKIGALFMSGYTGDVLSSKGRIEEDFDFIAKPLVQDMLLHKVREVLDKGAEGHLPQG